MSKKTNSFVTGALIIAISNIIVKIIGGIYKIPLDTFILGKEGIGVYSASYTIYNLLFVVSTAGLPVAISNMVSKSMALGRYRDVKVIHKVAKRLFLLVGIIGTLVMFILAYPYALSAKNMDIIPAVLIITPSIFFCCVMSSYRGYYNGLRNMTPTAISQVIEAGGKLLFGLALAEWAINYGLARFEAGQTVFGQTVTTEAEAMSAIYPYAAAGATAGVTFGTVLGVVYLVVLHKIKGDRITKAELMSAPKPEVASVIAKKMLRFAIPVALSSLVFSITNLIDAITVQNRLETVVLNNMDLIREMYATQLVGVLDADVKNFLYGAYSLSLDFRNLIPSITMTLGISAIPALSAAWAVKDKKAIKVSIESVMRVTMLVAMPCGIGMGVLAQPILAAFYGSGASASGVSIAAPVLTVYGFTIFLIALSQPMTNMLQALDKTKIPLISMTIGALVKFISNLIFVSIPSLNVNGAVIGTVSCYAVITIINLFAILKTTRIRINFISVFVKPIICGVLCGVGAYTSYGLCNRFIPEFSLKGIFCLGISICFGGLIYVISILFVKGIAKDDVIMLPKGEKIAKILAKFGFIE